MPKALITGASSGIGKEIAVKLSEYGYDLILAARRTDKLLEVSKLLRSPAEIITIDLSKEENCYSLYEKCKSGELEIVINNAGFGSFGEFSKIKLSKEMEMLDLNVRAVHILTKLFLKDFLKKDSGKILNVASAAGFMPAGPLLATYYASKAYVRSLTRAIAKELKKSGSNVTVSVLCPGPVKTEFDAVAGVDFQSAGMEAEKVAEIAVSGMLSGKIEIVPSALIKIGKVLTKILPDSAIEAFAYKFQKAKEDN